MVLYFYILKGIFTHNHRNSLLYRNFFCTRHTVYTTYFKKNHIITTISSLFTFSFPFLFSSPPFFFSSFFSFLYSFYFFISFFIFFFFPSLFPSIPTADDSISFSLYLPARTVPTPLLPPRRNSCSGAPAAELLLQASFSSSSFPH